MTRVASLLLKSSSSAYESVRDRGLSRRAGPGGAPLNAAAANKLEEDDDDEANCPSSRLDDDMAPAPPCEGGDSLLSCICGGTGVGDDANSLSNGLGELNTMDERERWCAGRVGLAVGVVEVVVVVVVVVVDDGSETWREKLVEEVDDEEGGDMTVEGGARSSVP